MQKKLFKFHIHYGIFNNRALTMISFVPVCQNPLLRKYAICIDNSWCIICPYWKQLYHIHNDRSGGEDICSGDDFPRR
jgi:hypothetical protein